MKQVTTLSIRDLANAVNKFTIGSKIRIEFSAVEPKIISTWADNFTIEDGKVFCCSGYSVYSYKDEDINETVYMVARWHQSQITTVVEVITEEGYETLEEAESYAEHLGGYQI